MTAQLLYEIGGPRYLSPDATARFDRIRLEQVGPDRVRLSGVTGEPPPSRLKVAVNLSGGWRNSMTLVLTGGSVDAKAAAAEAAVWAAVPGGRGSFDETSRELTGDRSGQGTAYLRLAVRGADPVAVGRGFSSAVVGTSLAGYPGMFATTPPGGAQEVARYWPTTIDAARVEAEVELDGQPVAVDTRWSTGPAAVPDLEPPPGAPPPRPASWREERREVPLGVLVGARAGDKGGDANLGLWVESHAAFGWLAAEIDGERLRELLTPVVAGLAGVPIERYELANLRALNFVLRGLLGWGVASNLRADAQAKGLGELVRSRVVPVPVRLLGDPTVAARLARWRRPSGVTLK